MLWRVDFDHLVKVGTFHGRVEDVWRVVRVGRCGIRTESLVETIADEWVGERGILRRCRRMWVAECQLRIDSAAVLAWIV